MNLSSEELSYLRAFEEEACKSNSSGWLDCEKARERKGINATGGRLATRLAGLGYLEQRKKGYPEFRITRSGSKMLLLCPHIALANFFAVAFGKLLRRCQHELRWLDKSQCMLYTLVQTVV